MTSSQPGGRVNRRLFLGLGAGALSLSLGACASVSETVTGSPKTYVLVHGAWHGGWCWRDVRARLEGQGHKVYTPTLTGLGERVHLLTAEVSLQTHIQDVMGVIEAEELEAVTLVGHSYGGMVITGVADAMQDRLAHIVYLDAAFPETGDTMLTQGPDRSAAEIKAASEAIRAMAPDGLAIKVPPVTIFGIDPHATDQVAWLDRRLTPHPLQTWFDRIELAGDVSATLPGTYILCTKPAMQNTSFAYHADQLRGRSNWRVTELQTGHDAMVSAPDELSAILLSAANQA